MFGVTKEKVTMIMAIIFLGIALYILIFKQGETLEKWVLSQRPRTYYAIPPGDSVTDFTSLNTLRRNPFVSAIQKMEYVIDLPLPDAVDKQFTLVGFQPLPDSRCLRQGSLKMSFGRIYPYDDSLRLALPTSRSLPPVETLQMLITTIHQDLKAPESPSPESTDEELLILKNGIKIKGKFVSEDKNEVWFVPAGRNTVENYKKEDISDIQRIYTVEELYEAELKKVSANDSYSWWRLSEWCFDKGLDDKASMALKEALKINSRELKFHLKLADYYLKKNDFDNEIVLYQAALQSALINKEVIYFRLGETYERLKLFKESQNSYEKAIGIDAHYIQALLKLANLYRGNQNYDSALKIYEGLKDVVSTEKEILEGLGFLEYQRGNFDKARESLLELSKQPDVSSETLNILGMLSVFNADYSAAGQYFLKAIYLKPNLTSAWTNLGLLYLSANLYPEAEMLFSEYADLNPTDEIHLVGLGYLKWLNNKTDDALTLFQSALKMTPDSFTAHYARGQLYFSQHNFQEAQQDFLRCLSDLPSFTETLYYLAMISFYQKDYKQSIQYYKSYFNQTPSNLISAVDDVNLSLALLGNDDIKQAKKILAESDRLKDYAPAFNISAYLDYNEHNVEQAIKRLEESLSIDQSNLYAKNSLGKIRKAATQSIISDNFERPDNSVIGRGWAESEKYGVEITLADKQCLFKGTQSLNETGLTTLEKTVSKVSFIRFEARLTMDLATDAIGGIYIANSVKDNTLFIARKKQQIVYGFSNKPDSPPAQWLLFPKTAIASESFKISLEAVVLKGRLVEFQCFIDDILCGIISLKGSSFSYPKDISYFIGIFGYGPLNKKWEIAVKNVRIFEEKTK